MTIANLINTSTASIRADAARRTQPPLVAHVIHRLAVGGLENGLVNLINSTAPDRYRHAIIALTDYTDFRSRIRRADVPVIALYKREGKDFRTHLRLWHLLRELRPAIVHTRNLPTLEFQSVAALAGVRGRIHGEHGRDTYDLDGSSFKYNLLRKTVHPFVTRYTAVSNDLVQWLVRGVGIRPEKVVHICNGVDIHRFYPRTGARRPIGPEGFVREETLVIGTVGRMETVKDQVTLVRAFIHLIQSDLKARENFRLVMIGDGPLRDESLKLLRAAGAETVAWLPGERTDIPELMRAMDIFLLPSIAEGISNTILEAMATGLPVVATAVGGNGELVEKGRTGSLVPASDPLAMATAIQVYVHDRAQLRQHGEAARDRVEKCFTMNGMIRAYLQLYDEVLTDERPRTLSHWGSDVI
jgi:sugar transferase (PEP-CTERM/EpsH1 system associated)